MKIISWNINGLRAIAKKGFLQFIKNFSPDIIALQETKIKEEQVTSELRSPLKFNSYYFSASRPGYSGTAIFSRKKPKSVQKGFGMEKFDTEGRALIAEFDEFTLFNIYFPNGKRSRERLSYKLDFYNKSLEIFDEYGKSGKNILIVGDFNTAHKETDLARPKENENISGFLKIERKWMDRLIAHGFIDCFRKFHKEPSQYTWWSLRSAARERNVGWRIDYAFANKSLAAKIKKCYHLSEAQGSDHCPVVVEM